MKSEDVYQVIKSDERFSILAEILSVTGIGEAFASEPNAFTFFAPTDTAMNNLSGKALSLLRSPEGKDLAASILGRHIVPGTYLYSDDLRQRSSLKPMGGGPVKVRVENNALKYGKAPIRTPGIAARNGVIFPIDDILPTRQRRARSPRRKAV